MLGTSIGKAEYLGTHAIMCTLPDPRGSYFIRVKCIDDLWSSTVALMDDCVFCDQRTQTCEIEVRELLWCCNGALYYSGLWNYIDEWCGSGTQCGSGAWCYRSVCCYGHSQCLICIVLQW